MRRARALVAALVAAALAPAAAGCGFGEGEERAGGGATLRVTRDFGHESLGSVRIDKVREGQTVMRMLRSEFDVTTRFGGRFVQSIDGLAGEGGGQVDWFFWVNGVDADRGAAEWEVEPGDHIQWDRRDWSAAMRVPAIVGAYPEPFASGLGGKRRPVRVECEDADAPVCTDARERLRREGVPTSGSSLGAPGTEEVTRLVVARWPRARTVRGASELEDGPESTGVFARFSDGRRDARAAGRARRSGSPRAPRRRRGARARAPAARRGAGLDRDRARREGARCRRARPRREQAARRVRRRGDRGERREASTGGRMSLIPVYRSRPSALHASRAGAGAALCGALALTGALYLHPLILSAALAAIVLAGALAGVGREIARSLRFALPFALLIAVINPLVYPEGDTLLFRGGEILGRQIDITLEATAAGVLNGLRVVVIVTAFGLLSAAVDPDELLRMFRRVSYRSALTATLATRLVPVLARDATRMSDAARCRPHPPGRLALARAALAGSLDRAVDVAAALEVRGYALGGRTARRTRPWSRHDWRVAGAALAIGLLSVAGAIAGVGSVEPYPSLQVETGGIEVVLSALVLASALVPFAGRAARMGVAHA